MSWFFHVVVDNRNRRLFSQGPRWLSSHQASNEAAALTESFWDLGSVRVFQWTGKAWARWL